MTQSTHKCKVLGLFIFNLLCVADLRVQEEESPSPNGSKELILKTFLTCVSFLLGRALGLFVCSPPASGVCFCIRWS